MTATATLDRLSPRLADPAPPEPAGAVDVPPLDPRLQLVRVCIVTVFVLSVAMLCHLALTSSAEHSAAQKRAFAMFRAQLARTTAPIGPTDSDGHVLAIGTPVAFLEIPAIGVKQVVGEGTTPGALFAGPGHRRDTVLPGQVGQSVVFGRRAAYGGPFADIDELKKGDTIKVTTGQGVFQYRVLGVRRAGDPVPPPLKAGGARLLLVTAAGAPFLPSGIVRVDADLFGDPVVGPAPLITGNALPPGEQWMGGDGRTLWVLAFWLQALIVLSVGVVWAWHRWGRARAWVVFLPPLMLVGVFTAGEVARLLPNLM